MCLLLELTQTMDEFLTSYKTKLTESDIKGFTDEELQTIQSAVVKLLRRHNTDNQLYCNDNENLQHNLQVTAIDDYGFVTQVKCMTCKQLMDTTCYEEWTKERIHDETQLKAGDHICWHRPLAIWHHAIVTEANPDPKQARVIHYSKQIKDTTLSAAENCRKICDSCNAIYRINHWDCYNAKYSILRAQRLLNENRYNLSNRNCEHFISWCKTGSAKSKQVSIFFTSLAKVVVTTGLRAIALFFLFLIQLSHEESEELVQTQNSTCCKAVSRSQEYEKYETVEKWRTCVYIVVATMIFMIHSLITSCSQLPVDRRRTKHHDTENQCLCEESYDNWTKNSSDLVYYFCCTVYSCYILCCQVFLALLWWKNIKCSPFTCCGRPGNPACGLFLRIFFREILGLIATVCIVVNEDELPGISSKHPPGLRAFLIILCIIAVQILGYLFGSLLGRWLESCCECSSWHEKSSKPSSSHEMGQIA